MDQPSLTSETENTEESVDAISEKLKSKTRKEACPFCTNINWFIIERNSKLLFTVYIDQSGFQHSGGVYILACTNCGFVRQHLRMILDGEVDGEVEYARSEG
jgi:hypothetical protein